MFVCTYVERYIRKVLHGMDRSIRALQWFMDAWGLASCDRRVSCYFQSSPQEACQPDHKIKRLPSFHCWALGLGVKVLGCGIRVFRVLHRFFGCPPKP